MTLFSSVGSAQALDGREAGLQAAHQALNRMGVNAPGLALVISSHQYQAREVLSGVSSLLGEIPMLGFSSPAGFTQEGQTPHSVVVALISGDFQAETMWFPGYAQSGRETATKVAQHAAARVERQSLLFFADGFNGDAEQFCSAVTPGLHITGGLSSGDLHTGNTYQMAGTQTGTGGLVAAFSAWEYKNRNWVRSRLGPGGKPVSCDTFSRLLAAYIGRPSCIRNLCRTFWLPCT
ncbi:MAG: hypothetical protein IPN96_23680 [Anaerolineales bacterium]|nr:hypothetical protein [Anaerolineales bacterium]